MPEQKLRTIRLAEDPWATLRHIVEVVALVAAGIWAFYIFVYQEKIKPAGEPASLDDTASVQLLGHDRTRDVLVVELHLHNDGLTEFEVAADGLNVWGDRYASRVSQVSNDQPTELRFSNDDALVSRRLITSFVELRDPAMGGQRGKHSTLGPGATVTIPFIIVVPRGQYDVIHAQAIGVPVKTPVRARVAVQIIRNSDHSYTFVSHTPGIYEDDNSVDFGLLP